MTSRIGFICYTRGRTWAHFAKAQWQDVVPECDYSELHGKRMSWVLRYWLSAYQGRDQYLMPCRVCHVLVRNE